MILALTLPEWLAGAIDTAKAFLSPLCAALMARTCDSNDPEQQYRLYFETHENPCSSRVYGYPALRHYRQRGRLNPRPGPFKHFVSHVRIRFIVLLRRLLFNLLLDLLHILISKRLGCERTLPYSLETGPSFHCAPQNPCVSFDFERFACDTRFRLG